MGLFKSVEQLCVRVKPQSLTSVCRLRVSNQSASSEWRREEYLLINLRYVRPWLYCRIVHIVSSELQSLWKLRSNTYPCKFISLLHNSPWSSIYLNPISLFYVLMRTNTCMYVLTSSASSWASLPRILNYAWVFLDLRKSLPRQEGRNISVVIIAW